jgi:hypothetical protein
LWNRRGQAQSAPFKKKEPAAMRHAIVAFSCLITLAFAAPALAAHSSSKNAHPLNPQPLPPRAHLSEPPDPCRAIHGRRAHERCVARQHSHGGHAPISAGRSRASVADTPMESNCAHTAGGASHCPPKGGIRPQ